MMWQRKDIMIIRFCPECGQKAEEEFKFCPNCGLKFPRDDVTETQTLPDKSSPLQTGHITPIKTSEVSVSVQNKPSCSPSNNKSPEKPSCSPKTGLTSPRKKGKLIKLEPLPENEVLTDNSNTKWVLAKVLANEKTVLFYEAHTAPRNDKRGQCILKLDSKDGKIYNEQTFFQRAAKKIAVDKWKKSHACPALGIPTCIGFGVHENYRFLVFSALGQNLQTIIKERKFGDTLPEQAVYQIVYRMIDALEYIHENEYVHGDITADNIFVNPDVLEVFLAGYYNAYRYCPAGKHVAYREGSRTPHEGTAEFISLDIHKGTGPTRRSDFESLGYCMLKWLSGSLPWSEETCVRSIMEYKKRFKTDVPGLLKQCFNRKKIPDVLKTYLEYVMTLEYEEMPDYEKMRKNISSAMEKMAVLPYDPVQL
ncbi:inactive serine/threonine-protein kinase VRK3 isoform X4 [Pseudophryne corroboree]|uniref:inactive serine/threonine-protein kinase VRK3 isoform X4 n=1 Tax=Pseudophryne corroboree TaxID=495146 RepID=UPI00308126A4